MGERAGCLAGHSWDREVGECCPICNRRAAYAFRKARDEAEFFKPLSQNEKARAGLIGEHPAMPSQSIIRGAAEKLAAEEAALLNLRRLDGGMALPTDAATRKGIPIYSGFIKYFPRAMATVAELSRVGNDQHNPGTSLHWDRSKSGDELDALTRHLLEAGTVDTDGIRHSAKLAWRAMANLEKELERASLGPAGAADV